MPISKWRPDAPKNVVSLVETMMAPRPEDRYQTPTELIDALERVIDGSGNRVRYVAAALLIGLLGIVGARSFMRDNGINPNVVVDPSESVELLIRNDRDAAEFIVQSGGVAYLGTQNEEAAIRVRSLSDLPNKKFLLLHIEPANTITPRQLQAVASASPWLHTVDIKFNKHLKPNHLDALKECPHLGSLVLGSIEESEITDEQIGELLRTLPQLYTFSAHGLSIEGSCLESVVNPEKLVSVKIGSMFPIPVQGRRPAITKEWILSLSRFSNLRTLSLPAVALKREHASAFHQIPSLRDLILSKATGIPECIDIISRIPNLEVLDINCPDVTDEVIESLHHCKTLRTLELYDVPVSEQALQSFRQSVPSCKVVL